MATWTDLTFAFASVLTSTKMTQLDANLDALAEGAAGAPLIQEAAMDTASVNRAALKTTTDTQTGTISASSTVNITLNGYDFFPNLKSNAGGAILSTTGGTVSAPVIRIQNSTKSSTAYDADWRNVLT